MNRKKLITSLFLVNGVLWPLTLVLTVLSCQKSERIQREQTKVAPLMEGEQITAFNPIIQTRRIDVEEIHTMSVLITNHETNQ